MAKQDAKGRELPPHKPRFRYQEDFVVLKPYKLGEHWLKQGQDFPKDVFRAHSIVRRLFFKGIIGIKDSEWADWYLENHEHPWTKQDRAAEKRRQAGDTETKDGTPPPADPPADPPQTKAETEVKTQAKEPAKPANKDKGKHSFKNNKSVRGDN